MADVKSIYSGADIRSQAKVVDITSIASGFDITSKANFNPTSKTDFNPTSVYTNADEVRAHARAESLAQIRETWMSRGCDLTDEEIREECEIVRQQLYDKYIAPMRT